MDILKLIKKQRKKLHLTQQQVADELYVSRNTYTQYENGTRKIDTDTFFALVEILDMNVTIKDFLQSDIRLKEINEKHDEWKREHKRFFKAIAENDVEKVKWYLDNGMDIDEQNEEGADAYMYALTQNAHQVVDYFLEEALISEIMDAVQDDFAPLAFACAYDGYETAKVLLDHGANPNQLSIVHNEKLPPLYIASRKKNKELFALLMEYGADINLKVLPLNDDDFEMDDYIEMFEEQIGRKLDEEELEELKKELKEDKEESEEMKELRAELGLVSEEESARNIFHDMFAIFVVENINEPRLEPMKKTTSQAEMMTFVYENYQHLMEQEVAETGKEFLREYP